MSAEEHVPHRYLACCYRLNVLDPVRHAPHCKICDRAPEDPIHRTDETRDVPKMEAAA